MQCRSDIFQFRQFAVSNTRSAMRVGTDGVALGALVELPPRSCTVWDAGSGTGLLSLMLAQRFPEAVFYAVEIDREAAEESCGSVARSPWSDRIHVVCHDVITAASLLPRPDVIVSNPPYFEGGERAPKSARALARHADAGSLGPESLIRLASEVLAPDGELWMITPADMESRLTFAATMARLNVTGLVEIVPRPGKDVLRLVWRLGRHSAPAVRHRLLLREADGSLSPEFARLTEAYYLDN